VSAYVEVLRQGTRLPEAVADTNHQAGKKIYARILLSSCALYRITAGAAGNLYLFATGGLKIPDPRHLMFREKSLAIQNSCRWQ